MASFWERLFDTEEQGCFIVYLQYTLMVIAIMVAVLVAGWLMYEVF